MVSRTGFYSNHWNMMNRSQGITYLCHIAEEGGELYEFLPEEAWIVNIIMKETISTRISSLVHVVCVWYGMQ